MNVLENYREILRMIDTLEESLYLLDSKATKCTTHMSDEIRCPSMIHDRMAEIAVAKCEISNRIDRLVLLAIDALAELSPHMDGLDAYERDIVILRYLGDMPWGEIVREKGGNRFNWYRILCNGVKKITTSCGTLDSRTQHLVE